MIKSAALLLVLSVILCHFSAEAGKKGYGHRMRRGVEGRPKDPLHNPPSDGIVSIRERRSYKGTNALEASGVEDLGFGGRRVRRGNWPDFPKPKGK
ncbi:hypothetical protein Ddc_21308 [Ditylenchus destructor]|nr:hypothetical protein Ddc_21308 [Ditylenchus destructor]